MAKYFVDVQQGADVFRDEEGVDCEFEQVCKEAISTLKEIGRDRLPCHNYPAVIATVRDTTEAVRYKATLMMYIDRLPKAA